RRAGRYLVDERVRCLGDVERDGECRRQADQDADDEADQEAPELEGPRTVCLHAVSVSLVILSGAPTPSVASALRSTCRVAASSARRARASAGSSTRKRSAA